MTDATDIPGLLAPIRKGMGGHHSPAADSEVWLTPPHVIAALGSFDLDPCACMEPRPWATAAHHYTRAEDGLKREWFGRVFCNPPYGGPALVGPWMKRMADHGRGTLLIFARTETALFHDQVWDRATAVLFLRGRLFFCRPDGTAADHNAGAPSCLVAYGDADVAALRSCGLDGRLVAL